MTIYRDEQHAAIRACAVDSLGQPVPAKWQADYRSGFVEELTKRPADDLESLTMDEKMIQDCMTRAAIHRRVTRGAFYALVAKYSADEGERTEAVRHLLSLVRVDAPERFKLAVIWAWCSLAHHRGLIEQINRLGEQSRMTLYRKRKKITDALNEFEKSALTDSSVILGERGLIRKSA